MIPQSSHKQAENSLKKVSEEVQKTPWFHNLSAHLQKMQHLQVLFNTVNEPTLVQQCHVLAYIDDVLYLQVNNTSLASRLRFNTRELIKNLTQFPEFKQIKSIYVKIVPPKVQEIRSLPPNPISKESAESIAMIANQVEDETLKKALLKLANVIT